MRRFCILTGLLVLVALLAICSPVTANDPPGDSQPAYSRAGSVSGVGRYFPGKWGVVSVELTNPRPDSVNLLSLLSFKDHPDVQFGRRIWVPGNARRATVYPVLTPATSSAQSRIWDLQSFLFDGDSQTETPLPARLGEMQVSSFVPLGHLVPYTALVSDPGSEDELTNLLWAARLSRRFVKTIGTLDRERLPATVESLDGLDHLMVSSNHVLRDVSACAAIRDWMYRGGHVWLHLNDLDPDLIGQLVGDALQICVVDRVQRERLQIFSHDSRGKQPSGGELQFDRPLELLRVVLSNARVSHSVDDWPVAAWTNVGRGTLLVTMLDASAWVRPRTSLDQLPPAQGDTNDTVQFLATEPLRDLAFEFLSDRKQPPISPAEMQRVVSEQIGYTIVSRQKVATLLGLFCLGLIVTGILLSRLGRLEYIGLIGPLGVLVASAVLLKVGHASREAIAKTVAVTQFAETSPYTDEIHVSGLAATYSADKSTDLLTADAGGVFWPNLEDRAGSVARMIAIDREKWELRNVVLPAGQQMMPFSRSYHSDQSVRAVATFGPDGLTGTISSGPFEQLSDAVLAVPSTRNLSVQLNEAGVFHVSADAVLAPGQFLSGGLLSDDQRRRIEIYSTLLDPGKDREPFPTEPLLLVWAKPLELGFQLLKESAHAGSCLISIPLQLTAPLPGSRVLIPGPFIRYRAVRAEGAVGAAKSVAFDERKRRWSGPFSTGLETTLRFQLPQEVLPLRLESIRLVISIKAPSRELQILGFVDGKSTLLESYQSPLSKIELQIRREDVLQLNETGELTLGINVGDARDDESHQMLDPSAAQTWKIDDVQLEVKGVMLPP